MNKKAKIAIVAILVLLGFGIIIAAMLGEDVSADGTCTDTDGGFEPRYKGTVSVNSTNFTDVCTSGTQLTEYFCVGNGIGTSSVDCLTLNAICHDGACIQT